MKKEFNDKDIYKSIVTIDIEGDAISPEINQKLFPNGCHMDPNTRIWCCTFTIPDAKGGTYTRTLVCKLPDKPREIIQEDGKFHGWYTKSIHKKDTVVPSKIDTRYGTDHIIRIFDDYIEFLNEISAILDACLLTCFVVCKGYNKVYNYDKLMLEHIFKEHNISIPDNWDNCVNAIQLCPNLTYCWKATTEQVHLGSNIPNQEYIIMGIKHNIEDSVQLYNLFTKQIIYTYKLRAIKKDF